MSGSGLQASFSDDGKTATVIHHPWKTGVLTLVLLGPILAAAVVANRAQMSRGAMLLVAILGASLLLGLYLLGYRSVAHLDQTSGRFEYRLGLIFPIVRVETPLSAIELVELRTKHRAGDADTGPESWSYEVFLRVSGERLLIAAGSSFRREDSDAKAIAWQIAQVAGCKCDYVVV